MRVHRDGMSLSHKQLSVVASISSRISVKFRNYNLQHRFFHRQHYTTKLRVVREQLDKKDKAHLDAIRSRIHRRKQKKIEKKKKNEAVDGFEDTVDIRLSGINTQQSEINAQQELEVEDALEVTEPLRSLMIG